MPEIYLGNEETHPYRVTIKLGKAEASSNFRCKEDALQFVEKWKANPHYAGHSISHPLYENHQQEMPDILKEKLAELERLCRNALTRADRLEVELAAHKKASTEAMNRLHDLLEAEREKNHVLFRTNCRLKTEHEAAEAENALLKDKAETNVIIADQAIERLDAREGELAAMRRERDELKHMVSLGRYAEAERFPSDIL